MLSRLYLLAALGTVPLLAGAADFCVAGSVVNALTGEPLHRAAVTTPQSSTLTDASGAFRFCGLAAGVYSTNAEKPGFAPAGLRVTVGPSREDVLLRLQPLAVVKGRVVVDATGEPLENALIQLLSITTQDGRRKVKLESSAATEGSGEYRLPGVAPGKYLLRAAGWQGASSGKPPESSQTFAPTYYGGAGDLVAATPLRIEAGRDVSADFSVTLEPSYRIRGALAGFSAALPTKIELLGPEGDLSAAPATFHAATGGFQIDNVPPGSYTVRATQGEGDQRLRGEQALQVGSADVNDVPLPLSGGVTLKGTVRIQAAAGASASPPNCSLRLKPAAGSISEESALDAVTGQEGEFEVAGVLPGQYRVRIDCASGYIAAAHAGQTDLLANDELLIAPGAAPPPLEVVLNADAGTLDVTAAQDADGDPATVWLALVPDSGNDLHTRFAILQGKLSVPGVAPGDYRVYAWIGSPYEFEYMNPAARQAWAARAATVHLGEREHQSITVKVSQAEAP